MEGTVTGLWASRSAQIVTFLAMAASHAVCSMILGSQWSDGAATMKQMKPSSPIWCARMFLFVTLFYRSVRLCCLDDDDEQGAHSFILTTVTLLFTYAISFQTPAACDASVIVGCALPAATPVFTR